MTQPFFQQLSTSERRTYEAIKKLLSFDSLQACYNSIAKSYDEDVVYHPCNEELIDLLNIQPSMKCLDLACGTGHATIALAQRVSKGKVRAVDFSSEMLEVTREKAIRRYLENIEFSDRDVLEELKDLPERSFDLIFLGFALTHLEEQTILREMRRILRPDGKVGILTSSLHSLLQWQPIFFEWALKNQDLAQRYAVDQLPSLPPSGDILKERLIHAGFSSIHILEKHQRVEFPTPLEATHYLIRNGWICDYFYHSPQVEERHQMLDGLLSIGHSLWSQGHRFHADFEILLAYSP
jgi:ubiquinone/menaquinone biosynthesis C-methylase UbiE